jgi:hypothetical protein
MQTKKEISSSHHENRQNVLIENIDFPYTSGFRVKPLMTRQLNFFHRLCLLGNMTRSDLSSRLILLKAIVFFLSITVSVAVYTISPVFCINVSVFLIVSILPKSLSLICVPVGQVGSVEVNGHPKAIKLYC